MIDRLRRVTDLFVEGTERYLGMDQDHKPILIWVNKLNSFETEEARRDGLVRRGERILALSKDDNPERRSLEASLARWTDEELASARVGQVSEEIYLQVINDIESEEEWREKLAMMRRLPQLLADQQATDNDPRRKQLDEVTTDYLEEIRKRQETRQKERLAEFTGIERSRLERDFFDSWTNRVSLDEYMEEKQVTELFYAIRDCVATEKGRTEDGVILWDHTDCNHASRLCNERSQVRSLPEAVIEKAIEALESISIPQRESGNSDAPPSSSGSSEQPSTAEDSTVSTPDETPPAAPMTSASQ